MSFTGIFKDEGFRGIAIITKKSDMPARKQSEVLWSHGKLGIHDFAIYSQMGR